MSFYIMLFLSIISPLCDQFPINPTCSSSQNPFFCNNQLTSQSYLSYSIYSHISLKMGVLSCNFTSKALIPHPVELSSNPITMTSIHINSSTSSTDKDQDSFHFDWKNREKNSIETSQRVPHTGTNSTRNDLAS